MSSSQEERLMTLQNQVEKLQGQKDTLLKELDAVEERFERTNRLYRRYIPVIIDTMAKDRGGFAEVCKDLSTALKKGDSEGKIAYIFERLKTAMLKEDIGPAAGKKKGLFSLFLKSSAEPFIDEYKISYHELVNTLRSTLGKKYAKTLDHITAGIKNAENTDDISEIREWVFSLVYAYISDTSEDQAKVNEFIRDVVTKILDIESTLAQTYEQTDSMFRENEGFEFILGAEVQELRTVADVSYSLEPLKMEVAKRLDSIENALKKKQAKDRALKEIADKTRHAFKNGFVKLKKELDKATRQTEQLEKKLNLDQLTGAYNRRAYDNRVEDEMERFLRYGTSFSLLVIDADRFKTINDKYGHSIGDRCLQEIIKRSLPLLRKNDMLARYGGEEFVVIMPETDQEGAVAAAEKIRQTIEKIAFIYKKDTVKVTVSIGVTQAREGDKHHQQVFDRADIALYQAKQDGRNRVLAG